MADYITVNDKINCYPNDANKIFLELKDFNHISIIDLSSAFHQLSIHKNNREYFAFYSQLDTMQYKHLIMGDKNSTILFQLAMEHIFKFIEQYIKIFVDDIIIVTLGSFKFHRDILFKFFSICNDLELKLSFPKCITLCDESVDKLIRRHVPTSKKELYNFFQSASYFRRCLPDIASKTADLFTLATKHALRYFGYLVANIKLTIRRDHKCLGKIMTTNNRKYIELLHGIDKQFCRITYIPGCNNQCNAITRTSSNPQHQVITSLSMTENIAKLINSMNLVEEQQVDKDIIEALEIGHVKNHLIPKNSQEIVKIILVEKLFPCDVCLKHNIVPTNHPIPSSIPRYQIMENLVMDFSGPHSEVNKNKEKYLLVIVDSANKYLWTIPMHTTTDEKIIKVLTKLFLEYGFCKTIKSDNAKYFNNEKITYLKILIIEMIFTNPSHSRGNILAEAIIRYVHLAVGKAKSQFKSLIVSWTKILPWTTSIHNTNICESTNATLFSLMFLRESPNPVNIFMKSN
uniref:Integrase catalytic domain-containing protein n=1 Tax=Strongyloides venezuelensis TaxID=75913 RepID=A0A0K0FQE7_STRVS